MYHSNRTVTNQQKWAQGLQAQNMLFELCYFLVKLNKKGNSVFP